jgi:probable HAF family extracellular repeat protein
MNITWLRSLLRRYGGWAVPVVVIGMLILTLRQRKGASLLLIAGLLGAAIVWNACPRAAVESGARFTTEDAFPQAVTITDLGTLKGGLFTMPTGVNAQGQVVGLVLMRNEHVRSFLWQRGKMTDLGTLGGSDAIASGVSERGHIAGIAALKGDENARGFLWQSGKMTDLGDLGGGFSAAYGVNGQGVVTGFSETSDAEIVAFEWKNGSMKALPNPSGSLLSLGIGINARGAIAGMCLTEPGQVHGVVWESGKPRALSGLNGGDAAAVGINDSGLITGNSMTGSDPNAPIHAVVWKEGRPQDLGSLPGYSYSFSAGINNRGDVAGVVFEPRDRMFQASETADRQAPGSFWHRAQMLFGQSLAHQHTLPRILTGKASNALLQLHTPWFWNYALLDEVRAAPEKEDLPRAVVWSRGRIRDLNSMLPRNSGWKLLTADCINNRGQIAGVGVYRGELRAYLLSPEG